MKNQRSVVLVTGATGFIGRHVAQLLKRDGWSVRRAVRHASGNEDELLIDSIGATTAWQAALEGVDAVVHLAARVHFQHEEQAVELYRSVNIEGTLHLARCAVKAGVRDFIFLSTVLVHGRSNDGRSPFSEANMFTPIGIYGQSKAAAEAGLKVLAQRVNMRVTVIRPPLVYGSGAKGTFARLVKAVKLGVPLPFAAIQNKRAFVSVQNLSSFISYRLAHPGGKFETFLVADQEQVSTSEFVSRLAKAAGKRLRLFAIPRTMLRALLKMSGRQELYDSLIGSLELDLSKAASIGWRPQVTLDQGLQEALVAADLSIRSVTRVSARV